MAHEVGMAALGVQQLEVVAGLILVRLWVFRVILVQKALRLVVLVGKARGCECGFVSVVFDALTKRELTLDNLLELLVAPYQWLVSNHVKQAGQ